MTTRRLLALLVALATLAAGCAGSPDAPSGADPQQASPEPDPEPTAGDDATDAAPGGGQAEPTPIIDVVEADPVVSPGGTLRVGVEADVDGLNPTTSSLSVAGITMAGTVFDNLTALDVDGKAVPHLARSVEPVDGDLTHWRLELRPGITFHDGTPLDAEAVRLNFETQVDSQLVGLAVRPFVPDDGAVEVIDDLTVEFRLLDPTFDFPAVLATQLGMVASPTWLAAAEEDPALNQLPVGTGPFRIDTRTQDAETRVVRNEDWWGGEVPLDAVEFVVVVDSAVRGRLLLEGAIDALHVNDPATVADLFDAADLQHIVDETGEETFLQMNTASPPFDDIRARRALALATPLQNYRTLIGLGIARPADQIFIPESPFHNPDVVQDGDDPDAAAALAAEYCADVPAGCTDGRIAMEYQYVGGDITEGRAAEILAQGWQVAFDVRIREVAQDTHIQQTVLGAYQVVTWRGFGADEPSGNRINLLCRTIGAISLNFTRYCDPERDRLVLEAQATEDLDARVALWQDIVARMDDAATHVFLTHTLWATSYGPDVRGMCDRTSPDGVALRCAANGRMWFPTIWLDR